MNLLKVLAIDDEAPALRRLVKMIEDHPHLILEGTARNAAEAKEKILALQPDLLLLDIELKDESAFDLLADVKNQFHGKIIFSTAYDQYALKAFDVEAIDYLLKPYSEDRFNAAIDRIMAKKEESDVHKLIALLAEKKDEQKMLMIAEGNKNYFLNSKKLMYILADGYYSEFISQNEKKIIRTSLKKLEENLPKNFVRINKSTILNLDFISELILNKSSSKIVLPDKIELHISDKYLKEFQVRMKEFNL